MMAGLSFDGLNQIADAALVRAVDSLVMGALIATFAAVILRVSRRQSSAVRFAVWFSALVAIAVLPGLDSEPWSRFAERGATNAAALTVPSSWAMYFLVAWGAIAAIALARIGFGLIRLYSLRKSFTKVDLDRLDEATRKTLDQQQLNRAVDLCTSERVSVPTAIGIIKPAVVLPAWLMDEVPPAELNQILLHELSHLRRYDDWTNLAQKVVKALFFFHPAVWWIEKKISLEREMACDDAVLESSASPRAYAECLVHLAEKSVLRRGVALAQAAVGKIRQTSLRVAQILDVNRPTGSRSGWKLAVSLVAGFAVLSVVGISRAPRLVAFEEAQPETMTASSPVSALPPTRLALKKSVVQETSGVPYARMVNAKFVMQPEQLVAPSARIQNAARATDVIPHRPQVNRVVPSVKPLLHLTNFHAAPNVASGVFVVVEQDTYEIVGQAAYRVSVWQVLLLPSAADSSNRIPRKEI